MNYEKSIRFAALTILLMLIQFSWMQTPVSASPSPSTTITEWTVPTSGSSPFNLVVYGGKVYFTEEKSPKIGYLNPATNTMREWTVPTLNPDLRGVTVYQGKIWFTEWAGNKIGRLDPATNMFKEWKIPTLNSQPWYIAVSSSGMVWFTEFGANKVGRLNPSTGVFTEWTAPGGSPVPFGITIDSSGRAWFTRGPYGPSTSRGKISRLDPSTNTLKEWFLPDVYTGPSRITISADSKVWFTEFYADRIARLDYSTNRLTEWNVPRKVGSAPDPDSLVEDAMGNIFFTEQGDNQIGKLKPTGGTTRTLTTVSTYVARVSHTVTPASKWVAPVSKAVTPAAFTVPSAMSGSFTEWNVPTAASQPKGMFTEDGTTFYVAEVAGNKIAKFTPQYTFIEWDVPANGVTVYGGKVWYTDWEGDKIGRLDPSADKITEWSFPSPRGFDSLGGIPNSIVAYGGKLWFTEEFWSCPYSKIGRLDPVTNTFTEWEIMRDESAFVAPKPGGISVYNGIIWFTETGASKIGRLDPTSNTLTEWTTPTPSVPRGIFVYGGKVWYNDYVGGKIGRLDPSTNIFTEWTIPMNKGEHDFDEMVIHNDIFVYGGKVWFTTWNWDTIGRLDPSTNKFTMWTIPTPLFDGLTRSVSVYGGEPWFAEFGHLDVGYKIGKLYPTGGTVTTVTPISTARSHTHTVKTPTYDTVAPITRTASRIVTDVTGIISGPFVECALPNMSSHPAYIVAPGGGEVWFSEYLWRIGRLG